MSNLHQLVQARRRMIGVAVGSGMAAAAAEAGGADLVMVLNAGFFRSQGVSSMAALLPLANANELTWEIAQRHVLPRVTRTPVVVGLCAHDPVLDLDAVLARFRGFGVAGVTNFPTVGFLDGQYREAMDQSGYSLAREVEMLAAAKRRDFFTVGFCFNPREAIAMAEAGVDVLNLASGFADYHPAESPGHQDDLDRAVAAINAVSGALRAAGRDAYLVVVGGPVILPQDAEQVFQRTGALGYLGGSSVERFPAAETIVQTVREFKLATVRDQRDRFGAITARSERMHELFETIRRVAQSNAAVLILGESGTGKELVAREIHRLSPRGAQALVCWNCGATSENLAMSELFGHEKGAFTGATSTYLGKFETADGATLFMDEVVDLPLSVQASLLRVLQEREIVRVGSQRTIPVDVRLVAASNKDVAGLIQSGRFRLDLYYRLSTVVLAIPPLRDRTEDIPLLVREFVHEFADRYACRPPTIPDAVMDRLMAHQWPGNIRQLRGVIERGFVLGGGGRFRAEWFEDVLAMDARIAAPAASHDARRDARGEGMAAKRARLPEVLARLGGSKAAAARELGVTRRTVYQWLQSRESSG
ncbi:MAG: sigma-54-dependent Fis family transcriptional regulator [Pirellulales bacterium]|nr:sigma-54-dependent Fis family transcriptional regulator [Pirellulales bacterium]